MEEGKNKYKLILISAALIAVLFDICFDGYITVTSFLFFNGLSIILFCTMKNMELLRNKKAFLLAIPIFYLSVCNSYFEYSHYTVFNWIGAYVLLVIMTAKAYGTSDYKSLMIGGNMIEDTHTVLKWGGKNKFKNIGRIFVGLFTAVPVVIIIGVLLSVADKAFSNAVEDIIKNLDISIGSIMWDIICIGFAFAYFCRYFMTLYENRKTDAGKKPHADTVISVSFLTPINFLFLFFCWSQLSYVGVDIREFTTYSNFVREGFFQLLWVTFINFAIILVFTEIMEEKRHKAVDVSLITLCVFTFILILSSFYRLFLYMGNYGFTPLRIEVMTFLIAETVLVFITIKGLAKKRKIFGKFVFMGILGLMVLNIIARPEVSAALNLNMEKNGREYMTTDYYEHTDIPVLIEKYNRTSDLNEKSKIRERIEELMRNYQFEDKDWKDVSIQEIINENMAEKFIGYRIEMIYK